MEEIDATPTWEAVLPLILEILRSGSEYAKAQAREELLRMAKLADKYVAAERETK